MIFFLLLFSAAAAATVDVAVADISLRESYIRSSLGLLLLSLLLLLLLLLLLPPFPPPAKCSLSLSLAVVSQVSSFLPLLQTQSGRIIKTALGRQKAYYILCSSTYPIPPYTYVRACICVRVTYQLLLLLYRSFEQQRS